MTQQSPSFALIDAHCHIDLYPDPAGIARDAERERIYTIAVTNAPSVFAHTARLCAGSKFLRPAIGLHPELVASHGQELDLFRVHLRDTRYIGEVGLDYITQDHEIRVRQRRILETIVGCASEYGDKVLTLHSRRAVSDVLKVLKGIRARCILHWFTGTQKELDCAVAEGYFFSVNGAMIQSAKSRALVARIPRDRILTETDGPFVKDATAPATPRAVKKTVDHLANLWQLPAPDIQATILKNFRTLLA
ncbi:MAG TPA: Qat anti-phage system TatD family nuclease QatD [Bryobacteraceae bacterium]